MVDKSTTISLVFPQGMIHS